MDDAFGQRPLYEKPTFRQVDLEPVNTTASLAGNPVNFPHFARVGPLSDIRFHSPNFAETIPCGQEINQCD
jgi:hypothetical protein